MREALREAEKGLRENEVPVGAVVVCGDKIIGRGHNRPISTNDPTAHAEILALRKAARRTKNYRLTGCDLYVTIEPCPMCAGAMVHARIARLFYGAPDPRGGGVASLYSIGADGKLNHTFRARGGILEEESRELLRAFFRKRRGPRLKL